MNNLSEKNSGESIMRELIEYTRDRAIRNETFTGAFIVRDGEIISKGVTSIIPDKNPIAHAEMKVITDAIAKLDGDLSGCHLFTTQFPCMMCASAMVWSRIDSVTYGWNTSKNPTGSMISEKFLNDHRIRCVGPVLEEEVKAIESLLPPDDQA